MSRSARYNFILVVVALSGCLAAFGGWRFAKASAPVNGPIVLVSIDSLRADRLPAYGYHAGLTPAIDALAADAVVFDRAYSHVPQTLPAHAALLTGRLPIETGVRDVAGFTIPGSVKTLAELLRDRGYATGGIVSSFLLRKDTGIARGFTFFDGELPAPDDRSPDAWLMRDAGESEQIAEHWLDSIGTSRAFLFLHIAEPHAPHAAPDRFAALAPYDAEVAYSDEVVGRLVRYLKAHQLYDRSTIVLVSDHGEGLGDHGEQGHGLLAYDATLHIPLIVKPPAGEGAGRRVKTPVQQIDLVPTILDLAKAPGSAGLRGRSLTPLLGNGSIADTPIYAESNYGAYRFGWAPITSVISGAYQLVSNGNAEELFDITTADSARTDVAAEKPDVVATLRRQLADLSARPTAVKPSPVTQTDRERFEALGYVGVPGATATTDGERPGPAEQVAFVEHFRSAVLLSHNGNARDAIDAFSALAREQPGVADVWMQLARVAAKSERHDVAIEAYRKALELEPENLLGRLGAATSSLRARRLDDATLQAQAVLDSGAADGVQSAEAHELLARVALNRRDVERANAEAEAAESADPKRPVVAFIEGRVALDQARYSEAVESFERALASATKWGRAPLADLRVYAADALMRAGRPEDAEVLLTAELTAFPANARAHSALQALYRSTGRAREATALAQH